MRPSCGFVLSRRHWSRVGFIKRGVDHLRFPEGTGRKDGLFSDSPGWCTLKMTVKKSWRVPWMSELPSRFIWFYVSHGSFWVLLGAQSGKILSALPTNCVNASMRVCVEKLVKASVVLSWLSLKSRECSRAKPVPNTSENCCCNELIYAFSQTRGPT